MIIGDIDLVVGWKYIVDGEERELTEICGESSAKIQFVMFGPACGIAYVKDNSNFPSGRMAERRRNRNYP